MRKTPDRTELHSSGEHTIRSHARDRSRGLSDQQRLGVQRAVRACPMQSGSAVIDGSGRGVGPVAMLTGPVLFKPCCCILLIDIREILNYFTLDGFRQQFSVCIQTTTNQFAKINVVLFLFEFRAERFLLPADCCPIN